MSKRRFSIVTAILLLLLAAAIVNNFFIYRAYKDSFAPSERQEQGNNVTPGAAPTGRPQLTNAGQAIMPRVFGELYLSPIGGHEYDIIVESFGRGTHILVPVDAIELDIRRPGATGGEMTPAANVVTPGKYSAHVTLPSAGTWEVRARLHRGNETVEFAEKFELKD
jgi:hypothetical protein